MSTVVNAATTDDLNNFSHKITASFEQLISEARDRIEAYQGIEISKQKMHEMLDRLIEHPVGRSVFECKGLNGENIQFFIGGAPTETNAIIRWFCDMSPVVLATRERFYIFQAQLQQHLFANAHFASVPCGIMKDLLGLDLTGIENVAFSGIDLDQQSLDLAATSALSKGLQKICHFHNADAWQLDGFTEHFDVLTSNGLNIYVKEDSIVTELYKELCKTLKPGGTLITSFLVPPRLVSKDAIKQRILFGTIIGVGWQNFRTEDLTRAQLTEAGFIDIEVIYDSQRMFPTVTAKKPEA